MRISDWSSDVCSSDLDGPGSTRLAGMNPMLTHIKITTAKPSEKLYKLHDTLGLYLAVKPNGSKLWRMNYRFLGKQKTLHLGKWPAVGLAAARAKQIGRAHV